MAGSKKVSQDLEVELGEHHLKLRFSMVGLLALRDLWGVETDNEIQQRLNRGSISDLLDFFWAACRRHHPEITREQLILLFDDLGGEPLVQAVQDLVTAQAAPADPKDPPAAAETPSP